MAVKVDVAELEREYRDSWHGFQPLKITDFLDRIDTENRMELLVRLISAELEFLHNPPVELEEETEGEDEDERARPNLQLFMLRFPELREHTELVFRLSVLDYALRLKYDDAPPNADSYLDFCDRSQERLIRLLQTTEKTLERPRNHAFEAPARADDSTVRDSEKKQSLPMEPLPTNLGCFLLVEQVGRGGMGYVHSAIDLRSTAPVAVKVMRRVDPWSISRFYEEFSWLSQLNHPNLVKLYDAFADGDIRYFSMELVEGRPIREWYAKRVKKKSRDPWAGLRKVLGQAASAVHFLHEHGVLHCDIKSSNLMISAQRRAILLDLGLAVREEATSAYVGTIHCMAPEVLSGHNHTRASDWFSFGAMLFEVMTGEVIPIEEDGRRTPQDNPVFVLNTELLRGQLQGCDPNLASLCIDLLNQHSHHRPMGPEVLERLGASAYSAENEEQEVLGREQELAKLNEAYQTLRDSNRGQMVIVSGESGIGKTSTVRHWLSQVDKQWDVQLVLNCFRQDHTPLRLINILVQEMARVIMRLPAEVWRPALASRKHEIGRAFPLILQATEEGLVLEKPLPSQKPPHVIRANGLQKLKEWVCELSSQQRLLIVIDDAQWADDDSLKWITELVDAKFDGLVVAIDEPSLQHHEERLRERLSRLSESTPDHLLELEIGPLSTEASEQVLSRWSGVKAIEMTPRIRQSMIARSEGSPFLLQELFRAYAHLAKRDRISEEDWLADGSQNTKRRIGLLPIQSENVLQYLAVSDGPISFYQLQGLSRIRPDELQRTVNLLATQGWIRSRSREMETSLVIAHDKFRNIVLESMPNERVQRRHYRTARMLSTEVPPPWPRMAEHYWAADRHREGAACYAEAARSAFKQSNFSDALGFLKRAHHKSAERNQREERELKVLEANCLAAKGEAEQAACIFEELVQSSSSEEDRLLQQCSAGDQFVRAGDLQQGLILLDEVLNRVGVKRKGFGQTGLPLLARIATKAHSLPARVEPSETSFTAQEQCLLRLALPLAFLDNQLGPSLILHLKSVARKRGNAADLGTTYFYWAILLSLGTGRWRMPAARWTKLASRLAKESEDPRALGAMHLCLCIWHTERGRDLRSIEQYRAASTWFKKDPQNLHWEQCFLHWLVSDALWYTMQFDELGKISNELEGASHSPTSQFLAAVGIRHWDQLIHDRVEEAQQSLKDTVDIFDPGSQPPWMYHWFARVNQYLYEGDSEGALQLLESQWSLFKKSYILTSQRTRWQITKLKCRALLLQARNDPGRAMAYAKQGMKCARQLLKLNEVRYRATGRVYELLFLAVTKEGSSWQRWQSAHEELVSQQQFLFANALQWHMGMEFDKSALVEQAIAALKAKGVKKPERLMNVIIPLPKLTAT